jgi:hypothetical protein
VTLFKTLASIFLEPVPEPQPVPELTFESPVAEFSKARLSKHWIAEVKYRGKPLSISATDFIGAPNDRFLYRLPGILEQLEAMETIAREQVPELSQYHELTGIADSNDEERYDLSLWFSLGDDYETAEVRYVEFDGYSVVNSWV